VRLWAREFLCLVTWDNACVSPQDLHEHPRVDDGARNSQHNPGDDPIQTPARAEQNADRTGLNQDRHFISCGVRRNPQQTGFGVTPCPPRVAGGLAVIVVATVLCVLGGSARAAAPLYVTNWGSDNVSLFRPRPDGALPRPALVAVPSGARNPLCATLAPNGRWLYVSNWGSGGVSSFHVGRDGALLASRTFAPAPPTPSNSAGIAVAPNGKQLYVANFNNQGPGTVSSFTVKPNGSLTPLGATISTGGRGAAGVALDRPGRHLYIANMVSGEISTFAIASDGRPSLRQVVRAGAGAFFPALTPDGRHLLVANATANTVSSFAVRRNGLLARARAAVRTGADGPRGIAISPDGRYAYVAHFARGTGPGKVAVLRIHRGGAISRQGRTVPTGGKGAEAIALADRGHLLYVANFNATGPGSVTVFAVGRSGSLHRIGKPTPTRGAQPDFGGLVIGS
jgi:6-phosphogluconolactonase (cycloisomerase 2 family)